MEKIIAINNIVTVSVRYKYKRCSQKRDQQPNKHCVVLGEESVIPRTISCISSAYCRYTKMMPPMPLTAVPIRISEVLIHEDGKI
jgi:hypothetical protein